MGSQRGFYWGLSIFGAAIFAVMFFVYGFTVNGLLLEFIIFTSLMVVSDILTDHFYHSDRFNIGFGFIFAAAFLFGPLPAVVIKTISTIASGVIRYRGRQFLENYLAIFANISNDIVSCIGGWLAYLAFGLGKAYYNLGACIAGIVVCFLLHNIVLNTDKKEIRIANLIDSSSFYLISILIGIIMIKLYQILGCYGIATVFTLFIAAIYTHRIYVNLIATNRQLTALYDTTTTITSVLNLEQVMEIVLEALYGISQWNTACLFVYHNNEFVPAIYDGIDDNSFKDTRIVLKDDEFGTEIMKGQGIIIENPLEDERFACIKGIPKDTKLMVFVPLLVNTKLVGSFCITSNDNRKFSKRHMTLLSILASIAAVAITNAKLFFSTSKMAVTDGLTKLYNHSFIIEEINRQVNQAERTGDVVSLILIDIDSFKSYNDIYGHLIGDELLKNLSNVLKRVVRSSDLVGRYGGEEFAVILPSTSSDEAFIIAERIRQTIETTGMDNPNTGEKLYLTISAGVASYPEHAASVQDLINKADKALLYGAKKSGKNKVVVFQEDMDNER
jgi:diguanylate cyclase (GGDEF)-like protein